VVYGEERRREDWGKGNVCYDPEDGNASKSIQKKRIGTQEFSG